MSKKPYFIDVGVLLGILLILVIIASCFLSLHLIQPYIPVK